MTWDINGAQRIDEAAMPEVFANEERIAQKVADLMGLDLVSFPRYSAVDRLLVMEGLASAWLEIRTRTTPRIAYPDYRTGVAKWWKLREFAASTDVPTLIVVEWSCGDLGSINVLDPQWTVEGKYVSIPMGRIRPLWRAYA